MQIRMILEVRHPDGWLKQVHAPHLHEVETVGEFLAAVEKSKTEALAELPKWLPSPARSLNDTTR